MTEKRLLIVFCSFFAFAVIVQAKMVTLMCSGYDVLAEKQTVRTVDISAGRADTTDCHLNKITGTENQIKAFITSVYISKSGRILQQSANMLYM